MQFDGDCVSGMVHVSCLKPEHASQGPLPQERHEADVETGRPATRWVTHTDMDTEGLSSSVRKIFKLVSESAVKESRGIKRFFGKLVNS